MSSSILKFRNVNLSEKAKTGYLNIETGRTITDMKKRGFQYLHVHGYLLCGTDLVVKEFLVENGLAANIPKSPENLVKSPENLVKSSKIASVPELESSLSQCHLGTAGSVLSGENIDVDSLSDSQIGKLCPFHLSGLKGKGKITRVLDGDTVEMLIYVPIVSLANPVESRGRGKNRELRSAAYTNLKSDSMTGFFSLFNCRLVGIDFAEHNTIQGIIGTKMMKDLYERQENRVFYKTGKFDKYGRLLVELFTDANYKESINRYYDRYENPDHGRFVESYSGKTKSKYLTSLPTLSPIDVERCKEYANSFEPVFFKRAPVTEQDLKTSKPSLLEEEYDEINLAHGSDFRL